MMCVRPRRSLLFTPPIKQSMVENALASVADVVALELEDGVAPEDKDAARRAALGVFSGDEPDTSADLVIRINASRERAGIADLHAILCAGVPVPGLILPKIRSSEDIGWIDDLLSERGWPTRLHALIETNEALESVWEIARSSPRLDSLIFGGVDMAADLRCRPAWETLLYARSRVVHAAASVGLDAIDVPYLDVNDTEGLILETRKAKDLGFTGKAAIHPTQVDHINSIFNPTDEELERAQRIVKAFEAAKTGAITLDGKLVEKPIVREMKRRLAIGNRIATQG